MVEWRSAHGEQEANIVKGQKELSREDVLIYLKPELS